MACDAASLGIVNLDGKLRADLGGLDVEEAGYGQFYAFSML